MPPAGDDEKRLDGVRPILKLTGQIDQFKEHGAMADRSRRGFREDAAPFVRPAPGQQGDVHEVQASVAKTHFSQLLDEVERGTTFVVLRHGRPIARIVPDLDGQRQRKKQAIENIRKLAREREAEFGPVSVEEIFSSIHEGHKY
jgi:prevent-host-death family protein